MADARIFKKADVVIESLDERCQRYIDVFKMTPERQQILSASMKADVSIAKQHHKTGSGAKGNMLFLDTCVEQGPTGKENGTYYAVDFGGTNLRAVRCVLDKGTVETDAVTKDIKSIPTAGNYPRGLMDARATATELFDAIALTVRELMEKHGEDKREAVFPVGFTFSFAFKQLGIDSGEVIQMSKGYETGRDTHDPVVARGTDICLLLDKAFQRKEVPAQVAAILNDTTGTLISGAYCLEQGKPPCLIGAIIGTGLNICYADPEARAYGYMGSVINTEIGAFHSGLPRNIIDHEVDDADVNTGAQQLEKMVSGLYLPEICRRALLKIFQEKAPPLAWTHWSMTTEAVMAMAYDKTDKLEVTKEVLQDQLDWPESDLTPKHLKIARDISANVLRRSAAIIAVAIATLAAQTGRLQPAMGGVSVAVDGSVFTKNPEYQQDVREELENFLGVELARLIDFQIASDGSGKGAAILAAMPQRQRRSSFSPTAGAVWEETRRLESQRSELLGASAD